MKAAILQATNAQALTSGGSPVDVVIKKSNVVNDTPGTYQIVLGIKEEPKIRKTVKSQLLMTRGTSKKVFTLSTHRMLLSRSTNWTNKR